ncbi:MAG: S8 family peptidase [Paenibacillaceae bacterium]|nr:S8 family peptidase [Paenibacillaceae bacterium]
MSCFLRAHARAPATARCAYASPIVPKGVLAIRAHHVHPVQRKVPIAIIDTGIDATHPDLIVRTGYNAIDPSSPPYDTHGHGTHIAGTIAAQGTHVIGIAPHAHIHAIKAFDHTGSGVLTHIVDAIAWCIARRMRIINMSFGTHVSSDTLHAAIQKATASGIIVIASAGNDGARTAHYPARYEETIGVGALSTDGSVAPFSNTHPSINVYAPGAHIVSTWPGKRLATQSGTSMATAHVTGAVALLLGTHARLTPRHVHALIARLPYKRLDAPTLMRLAPSRSAHARR